MALNDIFRLAVIGIGPSGQQLVNVHHYRQFSALAGDNTGALLIDAFREDAEAAMAAALSASVSIIKYEARNITQPSFGVDVSLSPVVTGGISGQASSPTAPLIVTWRTGLIGRSRRGRSYWWPVGESSVGGGQLEGAFAATLDAAASALLILTDSVSNATYEKVIWSQVLLTATPVLSFTLQEFQGRMGSRRAGVGA